MIRAMNKEINDDGIRVIIEELDSREETICLWNACFVAANPCAGQACVAACFGISICVAGLHTL